MQKLTQQAAYANLVEFLDTLGGAILVAHSWAGILCSEICELRPDLVHGIVMYEPVGMSDDSTYVKETFGDIPLLGLYGDYIIERGQDGRKAAVVAADSVLNANGGISDIIDLPALGIFGNGHIMSQDFNNKAIADSVVVWLQENVIVE